MSKLIQKLQTQLELEANPKEQVNLTNNLAFELRDSDADMMGELAESALQSSREMGYLRGEAYGKAHLGYYYNLKGRYARTEQLLDEALKLFNQIADQEGLALTHLYQGYYHWETGKLTQGLDDIANAIKYSESPNSLYRAWCLYVLGVFYSDLGNGDKALEYLRQAVPGFSSHDQEHGLGRAYNSMCTVYLQQKDLIKAQEYGLKALKIHRSSGYAVGVARSLNDLGAISLEEQAYSEALYYFNKALDIRKDSQNYSGTVTTLAEIGRVHYLQKEYDQALDYTLQSLKLAEERSIRGKIDRIYRLLVKVYTDMGRMEEAVSQYEKLLALGSAAIEQEAKSKIGQLEERLQQEKQKQEAEIYRLKNVALKKAYEEIQDSIQYAKRLQEAMLPTPKRMEKYLPGAFVMYQPRDVLSGDIYWVAPYGDSIMFAVIDCTGHGVPGAILSTVALNAMYRITGEHPGLSPATFLDHMHRLIYTSFSHEGNTGVADGMDLALCQWHPQERKLEYAGAYCPLYYYHEGQVQILKGDRQSVGESPYKQPFTGHTLEMGPKDRVYLFTDGYPDQFGGPDGKRFMKKQLRELLQDIGDKPQEIQKMEVERAFRSWRGSQRQVDDVCLMGVGFP